MREEWTAAELAEALGLSERHLRRVADAAAWPHASQPTRGGYVHIYRLSDLPPDVQAAAAAHHVRQIETAAAPSTPELTEAARREAALVAWDRYRAELEFTAALGPAREAFCASYAERTGEAISVRTLRRWEAARREGGRTALAPRAPQKRGHGAEIPEEARRLFEALYLDQGQPTVRHCYRIVAGRMRQKGVELPSYHTFARYASSLDPAVVALARRGREAAAQQFGGYIRRDLSSVAPNDWWVGDHHRLDILCRGAKPGRVVRPWLTAWMDLGSRKAVGWYVFEGEPCSDTILLAFRRGALKHGVPRGIYIDNGQDYRSKAITGAGRVGKWGARPEADPDSPEMRSLALTLGLETLFALPYNARAKVIERWFETVKDQFCRLWPSFTGGTTTEKPEQLGEIPWEQLPEVGEVVERFELYVAQYHGEPHKALGGQTPAQAWASRVERPRKLPEWALRLACLRSSRPVKVQRHGVTLLGTHYWAAEMLGLFTQRVVLRYDPADVSEVHVYDLEDRFLCTAKNEVALAHGAGAEELRRAMAEQRRRLKQIREAREAYGKLAEGESALDLYLGLPTEPEPEAQAEVVELIGARLPERPRAAGEAGEAGRKDDAEGQGMATVASLTEAIRAARQAEADAAARAVCPGSEDEELAGLTAEDFMRAVVWAREQARGQEV